MKEKTYTLDQVLSMLESQAFADFYSEFGVFEEYITGDLEYKTNLSREQCKNIIKGKLESLLN